MAKSKLKKRPDGLYQISVVLEVGGKKKRKYFYGHTQQEAKRKMMDWEESNARGRLFSDVAMEWQKRHWKEIAAGTQTSYNPAVTRALDDFGEMLVKSIVPLDVKRAVDRMADQGYAHQSVVIYRSVLNQIFSHAVLMGDVTQNPAAETKIKKGLPVSNRDCPEDDELALIRDNVTHPFGLFAYMLLYTGLRRGELLALQWRDIDFGAKTIHVTKSVTYAETGNQPVVKSPKTSAGVREVVLLDRLAKLLFPLRKGQNMYLFGGTKPLTQSVYRAEWRRYCLDVGLWTWKESQRTSGRQQVTMLVKEPSVTPHQLRHAYATMCYEMEISPKDAQQLLGHSKLEVTMDTYTHIRKKRRGEVALKLNQAE